MANGIKYGQVTTEKRSIGEDEPVFILRARDALAGPMLEIYRVLCTLAGSPQEHLNALQDTYDAIASWQAENGTQVPQSAGYGE